MVQPIYIHYSILIDINSFIYLPSHKSLNIHTFSNSVRGFLHHRIPHKPSLTRHQVRPIRPNPSYALLFLPSFWSTLPDPVSSSDSLSLSGTNDRTPPAALLSNGPFRDSSFCCSGEDYATSISLPSLGRQAELMLPFHPIPAFTCV